MKEKGQKQRGAPQNVSKRMADVYGGCSVKQVSGL